MSENWNKKLGEVGEATLDAILDLPQVGSNIVFLIKFGSGGIRTHDQLIKSQLRYHCATLPGYMFCLCYLAYKKVSLPHTLIIHQSEKFQEDSQIFVIGVIEKFEDFQSPASKFNHGKNKQNIQTISKDDDNEVVKGVKF